MADWNTELPFNDVFRMSRPWISQKEGEAWGRGPKLNLDKSGWVTALEPGCWAETIVCTIDGGHYPSGTYVVTYDGEGTLEPWNAGRIVSQKPGRLDIGVDSKKGALFLRLKQTNPENHLRNIKVALPGTQPAGFRKGFLQLWRGSSCLRFMDWQGTNDSKQRRWADRPKLSDATWSERGVPVEVMTDLANELDADPWFCMPHQADDEYVREFAKLVKSRLEPNRKVVLEYSNEVWNGQFEQSRWAGQEGLRLGMGNKSWDAAWHYTAFRSKQIFKIWEEVFGGRSRLVRVLPSQAVNPYVSEQILIFQEAYTEADALAIAPYFGCTPSYQGDLKVSEVEGWTVDQALDYLDQKVLPFTQKMIQDQKKVADKYGLALVAYEGGQHMVGVGGAENSENVTNLFLAANAHPRMGALYAKYLDIWEKGGGGLFCNFSSVGNWSKWGSWGLLRWMDEDPLKSPKYSASAAWALKQGQRLGGMQTAK